MTLGEYLPAQWFYSHNIWQVQFHMYPCQQIGLKKDRIWCALMIILMLPSPAPVIPPPLPCLCAAQQIGLHSPTCWSSYLVCCCNMLYGTICWDWAIKHHKKSPVIEDKKAILFSILFPKKVEQMLLDLKVIGFFTVTQYNMASEWVVLEVIHVRYWLPVFRGLWPNFDHLHNLLGKVCPKVYKT